MSMASGFHLASPIGCMRMQIFCRVFFAVAVNAWYLNLIPLWKKPIKNLDEVLVRSYGTRALDSWHFDKV